MPCDSYIRTGRRPSREVKIGPVTIGGRNPVAVQTMTNCDTMDTAACLEQIRAVCSAGCRIVRLTAPGQKEGNNLGEIVRQAHADGLEDVALVADIHYTPEVALTAAEYVDKVRINPGNYGDPGRFAELIEKCRANRVAIRIGVNHGSLSQHVVDRWGDTPEGMVQSAMDFLSRCREMDFHDVVVSMKSSNVRVMVHAYRLLVERMQGEGMDYPLHLGVTEAGDGDVGRIKSAVGIGTLLADGIGDTIRVSLTEHPANEIPAALAITKHKVTDDTPYRGPWDYLPSPFQYERRRSTRCGNIGGGQVPLLLDELDEEAGLGVAEGKVVVLHAVSADPVREWREAILGMTESGDARPVILSRTYNTLDGDSFIIAVASDFGPLFVDGLADGICITAPGIDKEKITGTALSVLQAARARMSSTEYIACPGCGRTLFDLQSTLARVREKTSHLRKLKIAVMGCIVNGPGEMADADYGYVGAGRRRVTLYKAKEVVARGIPEAEAVEALVYLIKENGDWEEPQAAHPNGCG